MKNHCCKLFIHCESGNYYDTTMDYFIWTGPFIVSPSGKYMLVTGCYLGGPYETRLYDNTNFPQYTEIEDMEDYFKTPLPEDIVNIMIINLSQTMRTMYPIITDISIQLF